MNNIFRSIWNDKTGTFAAVSENARAAGKASNSGARLGAAAACFVFKATSFSLLLAFGVTAQALPVGGVVAAGGATISSGPTTMTVNQSTQNAIVNWQSFNIATGQAVQFVQPNASAVALNRVVSSNPSSILGNLSANGKVFLVNPNGILFGQGASVTVGGLVASTLNITDSNFMAARYQFDGAGTGTVLNQGSIDAAGGYVALLGANVSNQGVITANLGTVALAAGQGVTLDVAGDGLLNVTVSQGALNALVENGGMIRANGGQVVMTAMAAGELLRTVVNNTGIIEAQTLVNRSGKILLLADMQSGTVNVGGRLDASAPGAGNGGFIETSAAHVMIKPDAQVTTAASAGQTGNWLIDPQDFVIGGNAGDNISGATLSALLVTNSVTITTDTGPNATTPGTPPLTTYNTAKPGNGDIFVNDAVTWTASSSPTTLTLNAVRDVNVNAAVTATNGNFQVCCGRDVNVNAAITTTNGSVLLSAGRNVNMNAAMSTTDGNIMMCAAENVNIAGAIVLRRGSSIPAQSLGLPLGLTLAAGYGGTGPGVNGGTVVFAPLTPVAAITDPNAPVTIIYNPVSYTTPTDYSVNFNPGARITQKMLVFADGGSKAFDGTTTTVLSALKGNPAGVTLLAGAGSTANFDTATVGTGKTIRYTGYSLGGPDASRYALAENCCGPVTARTTATISPRVVVRAPGIGDGVTGDGGLPFTDEFYPSVVPGLLVRSPAVDLTVVRADTPNVSVVPETPEEVPAAGQPPVEVPPKYVAPPPRPPKQDRG